MWWNFSLSLTILPSISHHSTPFGYLKSFRRQPQMILPSCRKCFTCCKHVARDTPGEIDGGVTFMIFQPCDVTQRNSPVEWALNANVVSHSRMLISFMLCVQRLTAAFVIVLKWSTTTGIAEQDFLQLWRCHHAASILNQGQEGEKEGRGTGISARTSTRTIFQRSCWWV